METPFPIIRDIQVWKCGRRRRTDDGQLVYYKLTLWAFGSGELNIDCNILGPVVSCPGSLDSVTRNNAVTEVPGSGGGGMGGGRESLPI